MKRLSFLSAALLTSAFFFCPVTAYASVESSLAAIQDKLINVILPLVAILGLVFAGFSFVSGSPNARSHLILAIFGAAIGFGAPSIMAFIRGLIH